MTFLTNQELNVKNQPASSLSVCFVHKYIGHYIYGYQNQPNKKMSMRKPSQAQRLHKWKLWLSLRPECTFLLFNEFDLVQILQGLLTSRRDNYYLSLKVLTDSMHLRVYH